MQTGTILNVEGNAAPGGESPRVGTIQPHDGSEPVSFNLDDLNEAIQPDDQVSFDTSGRAPEAEGLQAVNVRVVK